MMVLKVFNAQAPGTLMLMGEHGVVRNYPALVCAIDKKINVNITVREDKTVRIQSALGAYQQDIDNLSVEAPFEYVLASLLYFNNKYQLTYGLDIEVKSEFSEKIGFGSSAAVTVAMVKALSELYMNTNNSEDLLDLFNIALAVIQELHPHASGADVAASIYGGVVYYCQRPLLIRRIDCPPDMSMPELTALYVGYKRKTHEVVAYVNQEEKKYPDKFKQIFIHLEQCVEQAVKAIIDGKWQRLGQLFNRAHGLMAALGVTDKKIEDFVKYLEAQSDIWGAKVSGAGLGDCVIGLGRSLVKKQQDTEFLLTIAENGVI